MPVGRWPDPRRFVCHEHIRRRRLRRHPAAAGGYPRGGYPKIPRSSPGLRVGAERCGRLLVRALHVWQWPPEVTEEGRGNDFVSRAVEAAGTGCVWP